MRGHWFDLRASLRGWRTHPTATTLIVVVVALGTITDLVAISVARSTILNPLPYFNPGELVLIWNNNGSGTRSGARGLVTPLQYLEWRRRASSFADLAALQSWVTDPAARLDVIHHGEAQRWRGAFVTPNFFELLGVKPVIGAATLTNTSEPNAAYVVISDGMWRSRFGGSPDVAGTTVTTVFGAKDRRPVQASVSAVLPRAVRFTYPQETEVWISLPWSELSHQPARAILYHVVGRLKKGVSIDQARLDMNNVIADLARDLGNDRDLARPVNVESLEDYLFGRARAPMLLLSILLVLMTILTCATASNLFLARASSRRRDIAVHYTLGASYPLVIGSIISDVGVLMATGAAIGCIITACFMPILRVLLPLSLPRGDETTLESSTIAYVALIASLMTVAIAVVPSLHAIIIGRGVPSARYGGALAKGQKLLVSVQVGAAVAMLVVAATLMRSFWNLQHVDLGFDAGSVLTAELRLLNPVYRDPKLLSRFHANVLAAVRGLPGVSKAGIASAIPFRGPDPERSIRSAAEPDSYIRAHERAVDGTYFDLMHMRTLAGRSFGDADNAASEPVAILSEALAQRMFWGGNAIGSYIERGGGRRRVIGVVNDVRYVRIEDAPRLALYLPREQQLTPNVCLLISSRSDPRRLEASVRAVVKQLDPEQPVENVSTLDQIVAATIADRQFFMICTCFVGVFSLTLALAGVYGVVAQTVINRRYDIGVRIALGAKSYDIVAYVMTSTLVPAIFALAGGALAGLWGNSLIQGFLFGIGPHDPMTLLAAEAFVLVGIIGALVKPTRAAMRLSPALVLREP